MVKLSVTGMWGGRGGELSVYRVSPFTLVSVGLGVVC